MQASFIKRHPFLHDALGILIFIVCVLIGTLLINTFIFRSFNVEGPSMESTLYTGDRLIVNRTVVTAAQLQNKQYVPERGQVIVFKNPNYTVGTGEEYIVKRVIAFPGERVVVAKGTITVFNDEHPKGFNPDPTFKDKPGSPTTGSYPGPGDPAVVPKDTLFVAGDHRQDGYSYDSRNGMGTIPYYDIVGPVSFRIFPFNKIRSF